ncbi:MAG: hypothetical protein RBT55_10000 [Rhodocyclaceae bacterium]|nr:hypothetical protein [Rhodocyclaceae bacterium]
MSWFNLRSHLKGYEVRKRGAVRRTIVSLVPGDIADVDEEKDDLPVDVEFEFVLAILLLMLFLTLLAHVSFGA